MKRLTAWFQWLLGYRGIPLMSRPSFRNEMIGTIFLGFGYGLLRPSFTQLFAAKSLQAADWMLAALSAQFAMGNLLGAFLSPYLQRVRRVPCLMVAWIGAAVFMAALALLPVGASAALPYVILLTMPALLMFVARNTLPSIWHSNYPGSIRGQVFSRRFIVHIAAMAVSVRLTGYALDRWPEAHRLMYPICACCLLTCAMIYRRVRVRHEQQMLRRETRVRVNLLEGFRLLWRDREYARFMGWQMLSGSMVLMTAPAIIRMLTEHVGVDYGEGTTALTVVPQTLAVAGALLSGKLFDRLGATSFRAIGAVLWASSRAALYPAIYFGSWVGVLPAFALQGLAQSTGVVAFNLSHTHFAAPQKSHVYMGVNLTLQGIRGVLMPFVGISLYRLPGVGMNLLLYAAGLQFIAALGFALTRNRKNGGDEPAGE